MPSLRIHRSPVQDIQYNTNLLRLTIIECPNLKTISNLPNLEFLYIRECHSLVSIPDLPNLKTLYIQNCDSLKNVSSACSLSVTTLTIFECDKLEDIPEFPNLEQSYITACPIISHRHTTLRVDDLIKLAIGKVPKSYRKRSSSF